MGGEGRPGDTPIELGSGDRGDSLCLCFECGVLVGVGQIMRIGCRGFSFGQATSI